MAVGFNGVGVAAASRVRCARARHAHFVARGSARPMIRLSLRIAGDIEEIDDDGKEQQEDADILAQLPVLSCAYSVYSA